MSFYCALQPNVCAKPLQLQCRKHISLAATSAVRVPILQGKHSVMCRSQTGDQASLTSELSLLDDTLGQLQAELVKGDVGKHEDGLLLAELVKKIETEQKAWIKECEEMDTLMAKADALNSSEEEVAALKEKHDKMKLKINMFSAVLREKEREVSVLEEQLEGVKLMGEMKQLKENAPQMVAAGTATADASVVPEAQFQAARTSSPTVLFPENPSIPPPGDSIKGRGAQPFLPVRNLTNRKHQGSGMNVPGVLIASVVITMSQTVSLTWSALKKKVPKPVGVAVEAAAFFGTTMALASIATHTGG